MDLKSIGLIGKLKVCKVVKLNFNRKLHKFTQINLRKFVQFAVKKFLEAESEMH